ncbi:uncharacterized protein LOC143371199 [Andrena cerasifolii]|uniref:uncharacterized protein LOC143371199 n=1 Tax=Andrena cerasifolii TaxID=2819439 RepID=UPI004037F825
MTLMFSVKTDHISRVTFPGVGVLIAVRNTLPCSLIDPKRDDLEQLFVRVRLRSTHLILSALYLPPGSQSALYEYHVGSVMDIFQHFGEDRLCVLGDFNLPHDVWLTEQSLMCFKKPGASSAESTAIDLICEGYGYCNLAQVNTVFNSSDAMVDLIFVNDFDVSVGISIDYLIALDAYHPPLILRLGVLAPSGDQSKVGASYYDFKCGDYPKVINYLNSVDWDSITRAIDPDLAVDRLYAHLNAVIEAYIPQRTIRRALFPRWMSSRLKYLSRQKKKAPKEFKVSNSRCDYWNFSSLRSQCKFLMKKDYRAYVERVENSVQRDVKSFWSFVNAKRGTRGLPSNMHHGTSSASSHPAVANLFATYFGSVYTSPSGWSLASDVNCNSSNGLILNTLTISIGDIFDKLNALDTRRGSGVDGIPPLFLKQCSFILSRPLWNIFNSSVAGGTFPKAWKNRQLRQFLRLGIGRMWRTIDL